MGSIIYQSPLLAGTVLVVGVVFIFLVGSALISSVRPKPAAPPAAADADDVIDLLARDFELADAGVVVDEPDERPRRRFGFVALTVAFVVGLGAGGLAVSMSGRTGSVVDAMVALVESTPLAASEEAAEPGSPAQDPEDIEPAVEAPPAPEVASKAPAESANDPPEFVEARLAVFAKKLRESLPRDAGPELSLTSIETEGMTVALGYAVGREVSDSEIKAFDAYVMKAVQSVFCDSQSLEIRYLNDNGVIFTMAYVDPTGETVAEITVPAGYCA